MNTMIISPLQEMTIFLGSILFGMAGAVVYDILRRIKRLLGINSFVIGIGDVISIVILAITAYLAVYILNYGKVRWYMMFGIVVGFGTYMKYFSKYFMLLMDKAEDMMHMILRGLNIAFRPVTLLVRFLKNCIKKAVNHNKRYFRMFFCDKREVLQKIKCIFRKI